MAYNLVKLGIIAALIALGIVAIGLDWVDETQGWAFITLLVGYIIGNAQVTSQTGTFTPIVSTRG